jgi:ABC-type multidrug transport system fused ATPase/permease subunit
VLVIDTIFIYLRRVSTAITQTYSIRDLRNEITGHAQKLPLSFTETHHSGDLVSRINNDTDKVAEVIKKIPEYISQPIIFILSVTYFMFLSTKLLLVAFCLLPFSAFLFNKVVKPIQGSSKNIMELQAKANATTQDAIKGVLIIKAFNLQSILIGKYKKIADEVEKEGLFISRRRAISIGVFLALRYIPQLVVPLYGGYLTFQGEISVGTLLACNWLIWQIFIPVETFLAWVRQFREYIPAFERVFEILDEPSEHIGDQVFSIGQQDPVIAFDRLTFGYEKDKPVLRDLNLQINKGQTAALVGPSGCGKSTVLKLLCGYYKPDQGHIRVLGNDMVETDLTAARKHVSLVSQETYLFPTSIAENIAYGRPGASPDEVSKAAKMANAHNFIINQPDGYQTNVGEWGAKLSGGEKQRISLARAILKDAPILLLDEPTSALDTQSEALVQAALTKLMIGRTVVIVAHRLSTIIDVDKIVVLDQGTIQEQGTHDELMGKDGLYKRLYLKQTTSPEKTRSLEMEVALGKTV